MRPKPGHELLSSAGVESLPRASTVPTKSNPIAQSVMKNKVVFDAYLSVCWTQHQVGQSDLLPGEEER